MSTIKVNKIENTATSNGGIEIANTGHVKIDGVQLPNAGPLSHRNMVINGGMMVAQRGTTGTVSNGYNQIDRVYTWHSHDGAVTESQSTDTPNNQFSHSIKHEVDTADTSIGSSQYHAFRFALEGHDSAAIAGWGTSDARKVTVSFWCKSSVTGEYGATMRNGGSTRFNQQSITINTADTWEYKTITYTGDTGGTWDKTNGAGIIFQLSLAMGTSYQGTAGDSWKTSLETATSNQVNWLATVDNTFYLTGLQIELGEKATAFEHRSYSEEFSRCQRYYQELKLGSSASYFGNTLQVYQSNGIYGTLAQFPGGQMRTTPTVGQSGSFVAYKSNSTGAGMNTTIDNLGMTPFSWTTGGWIGGSGLTTGHAAVFGGGANAKLTASAEL